MIRELPLSEPESLEAVRQMRHLILPEEDLFSRRAARFRLLAENHPLGDYLVFLSLLADAQQHALGRFPDVPLPSPPAQALCRGQGIPLLESHSWLRDPSWRDGLLMILEEMSSAPLPAAAATTVGRLSRVGGDILEQIAERILAGDLADVPPRELPFVAAALQVYWVRMVTSLGEEAFGRLDQRDLCPVCGCHPVVGIVGSGGGGVDGLRYLCCSLCASRWHMVRLTCSNCASTQGINHFMLDGSNGAVKAEGCDVCNSYLKLLYQEHDSGVEPLADDLATLSLDMLMAQEGMMHGGVNLLYHPGEAAG